MKVDRGTRVVLLSLFRSTYYERLGHKIIDGKDFSEVIYIIILVSVMFPARKFSTGKPFISKLWPPSKIRLCYYQNFPYDASQGSCSIIEYLLEISKPSIFAKFNNLYELKYIHTDFVKFDNSGKMKLFCTIYFDQLLFWIFADDNAVVNDGYFSPIQIDLDSVSNINYIYEQAVDIEGTFDHLLTVSLLSIFLE